MSKISLKIILVLAVTLSLANINCQRTGILEELYRLDRWGVSFLLPENCKITDSQQGITSHQEILSIEIKSNHKKTLKFNNDNTGLAELELRRLWDLDSLKMHPLSARTIKGIQLSGEPLIAFLPQSNKTTNRELPAKTESFICSVEEKIDTSDGYREERIYNFALEKPGIECILRLYLHDFDPDSENVLLNDAIYSFSTILSSFQVEPYGWWLAGLREKGLALPDSAIREIEEVNPRFFGPEKWEIAKRYDEVRFEIGRVQDFLCFHRKNYPVNSHTVKFFETAFRYVLFPAWSGGRWDLEGSSAFPQRGEIACGWYLQRIMQGAGFNIDPSPGVHMAQLASDEMIWSYSGYWSKNLQNWDGLQNLVDKKGPGLYLVGMSESSGHVLFLIVEENGTKRFCHAGPSPRGFRVTYDEAEPYVRDFMQPYILHSVKMDEHFALKWLNGTAIYPIKTKIYAFEKPPTRTRLGIVQSGLKELNYYQGSVDNTLGRATREAIGKFQSDNGLFVSYLPDNPTIDLIRRLTR